MKVVRTVALDIHVIQLGGSVLMNLESLLTLELATLFIGLLDDNDGSKRQQAVSIWP